VRRWSAGIVFVIAIFVTVAMAGATLAARKPRVHTYGYVTSTLALPQTPQQAAAFGRDIDGDGHVDNVFGHFLAGFSSQNLDFQGDTDTAIQGGQLLMLHSLRTPSWKKTKKATWQVLYAKATDTPSFDGSGVFTVDGSAPISLRLTATIRNHHVKTRAGIIPVELDLGTIVALRLKRAEIFATCSSAGCTNGRITGVITQDALNNLVIPQLAVAFTAIVTRDCPGPDPSSCAGGSAGNTLEQLFDTNDDLVISTAELQQNDFMKALLAPDIDTNHDGQPDAISVGLGFETVRAKLVR
jgi:hypothetical protein